MAAQPSNELPLALAQTLTELRELIAASEIAAAPDEKSPAAKQGQENIRGPQPKMHPKTAESVLEWLSGILTTAAAASFVKELGALQVRGQLNPPSGSIS